ncbi:MAG: hypothetical protein JWM59_4154 [Verrucomicrobiales bacterium]|nr:hypothetical protein [Verrucomicrobiales bacterium]
MSLLQSFLRRFRRPPVISLLHATRGRPDRARSCRQKWLDTAAEPARIEHIFAIDADDAESAAALGGHTVHVVKEPGLGCIGAWNLAAAHCTGDILVQLSDDWLPVPEWDRIFSERLIPVRKPQVLRISDGHRGDDLLCMAILTRARMKQQGWFLPPAYTGVYSDDEFSFRAYEDGVVVDARDIALVHEHPNYDPSVSMDETYRQQNDESKYAGAKRIFLERNPAAKKRWFIKDNWSERRWLPPGALPVSSKSST